MRLDGRGISIVGSSHGCWIDDCEIFENGDYLGVVSGARNGSGIEGFSSVGCRVTKTTVYGHGSAMEVKGGCDGWKVTGNTLIGDSYVVQYGAFNGVGSVGGVFAENSIELSRAYQYGYCLGFSDSGSVAENNMLITARGDFPALSVRNASAILVPRTLRLGGNSINGTDLFVYFQDQTHNQAYSEAAWKNLCQ